MNTSQLTTVLQRDPFTRALFRGVFPSDQLPSQVPHYPSVFIANVDALGKPGSHWCAFYFTSKHDGEFFDSYGQPPQDFSPMFYRFLENNTRTWTFNTQCLQSIDSMVCGHYCLYYALNRCRKRSMKAIVSRFTNNTRLNDQWVKRFIVKHFGFVYHNITKYVSHQTSQTKKARINKK